MYEGLTALQILRLEDARREEARRLGITFIENPDLTTNQQNLDSDISNDMIENYRITIFHTTIWQGLCLIAYSIVSFIEQENLKALKIDDFSCYIFITVNIYLYIFGILYNFVSLILAKYYKLFIKGAYIFQLILVTFTFFGISLVNSIYELKIKKKQYEELFNLMIFMICIRFFFYLVICLFLCCMSFVMCCALATG